VRVNDDLDTAFQAVPSIVVEPGGNAHCFWADGREEIYGGKAKVYYSFRPFNGDWEENTHPEIMRGGVPDIKTDQEGNLYALWEEGINDTNSALFFSYKPLGGDWIPKVRVTDEEAFAPHPYSLVVDREKVVHCVWADSRHGMINIDIYYAKGIPTGIEEKPEKREKPFITITPNPMRDYIRIKLNNLQNERVSIKIYDATGKLIKTLTKTENLKPYISWDGKDNRGRRVPSGVYFIRLNSEKESKLRKVIMLR